MRIRSCATSPGTLRSEFPAGLILRTIVRTIAGMNHRGAETRDRIVDRAFRVATRDGLEGLSIGSLATEMGMSKSGLFAHFGSKEDLQVEVLAAAARRFEEQVLRSAFSAPRGEPRIRRLFQRWMEWVSDPALPGGCLFLAAATELDDHAGAPRDALVASQRQLRETLARSARMAVTEGHLRRTLDAEQFAFDFFSVILAYHHARRLLRDPKAEAKAKNAFERVLDAARPKSART